MNVFSYNDLVCSVTINVSSILYFIVYLRIVFPENNKFLWTIYEDFPFSDNVDIIVVDIEQIQFRVSIYCNKIQPKPFHLVFCELNIIVQCCTLFLLNSKATSYSRLSTGTGHFRITVWNPALILAQIVAVQCLYYFTMCIWVTIISYVVNTSRSLDIIFQFKVNTFYYIYI